MGMIWAFLWRALVGLGGVVVGALLVSWAMHGLARWVKRPIPKLRVAVVDVLARNLVALVVYVLTWIMLVFAVWGAVCLGHRLWTGGFNGHAFFMALGIVAFVELSMVSAEMFWKLVRPLFVAERTVNRTHHLKVTKEECPRLFALIEEVCRSVHAPKIRTVYLAGYTNAFVSNDLFSWNLLVPTKKELTVGLGLLMNTSVDEVAGIIAHELGHFAQGSMRLGTATAVFQQILSSISLLSPGPGSLIGRQMLASHPYLLLVLLLLVFLLVLFKFGVWVSVVVVLMLPFGVVVKNLLIYSMRCAVGRVFRFVQHGALVLSRKMEYEADACAARCVGTDAFISALGKLENLAAYEATYQRILADWRKDDKALPRDYFEGRRLMEGRLSPFVADISDKRYLSCLPLPVTKTMPRVQFSQGEHPLTIRRQAMLRANRVTKQDFRREKSFTGPAWDLVPCDIYAKVSDCYLNELFGNGPKWESVGNDEVALCLGRALDGIKVEDPSLVPYFERDIFDVGDEMMIRALKAPEESPFTQENAHILAAYQTAEDDEMTLRQCSFDADCVNWVEYAGCHFEPDESPLQIHEDYLKALRYSVSRIESEIAGWVLEHVSPDAQEDVIRLYDAVHWFREKVKPTLTEIREALSRCQNIDKNGYFLIEEGRRCLLHLDEVVRKSISAADFTEHDFVYGHEKMKPIFLTYAYRKKLQDADLDDTEIDGISQMAARWLFVSSLFLRRCGVRLAQILSQAQSQTVLGEGKSEVVVQNQKEKQGNVSSLSGE